MPASHDSAVQSAKVTAAPKTAEGAPTSHITFFDLPAEIRDEIYDLVTFSISQHHSFKIYTWDESPVADMHAEALAQVNKQVRREFLSRYHLIRGLSLTVKDGEEDEESARSREWLNVFAESRIPITKSFHFWSVYEPECYLELRGAIGDTGSPLRFTVSQPLGGCDPQPDWFEFHGSKQELADLVDGVLLEDDGSVYLTADGLRQIIEYLEDCRKTEEGQA